VSFGLVEDLSFFEERIPPFTVGVNPAIDFTTVFW
jgi:hypothetical protein